MKNLFIALMVSATASTVMAQTADMITVRYNCKQAVPNKKVATKVQMLTGGFAGLTEIRVYKISKEKVTLDKYYVKQDKPIPGLAGGATVYRGQDGMSFSINQTTNPMMSRKATLVEEDGKATALLCDLNKKKN